jgi:hypothetical protein
MWVGSMFILLTSQKTQLFITAAMRIINITNCLIILEKKIHLPQ